MTDFDTHFYVKQIYYDAKKYQWRNGQYLFNTLPMGAANAVRGKLFDPFYKDMNQDQLEAWVNNHLILGCGGEVMAVFDGNRILWEKEPLDA